MEGQHPYVLTTTLSISYFVLTRSEGAGGLYVPDCIDPMLGEYDACSESSLPSLEPLSPMPSPATIDAVNDASENGTLHDFSLSARHVDIWRLRSHSS